MPKRAKQTKRRELTREQAERLSVLQTEESMKPIEWFKHDTDAHSDPAVAELFMEPDGHQLYGLYWLLVEHMAARDGHFYKIENDRDWAILTRDLMLYPRSEDDVALVKRFVQTLARLELISPRAYEDGMVESLRLSRNCLEVGRGRASKRLAGEITAQERWGDREKE